MAAKKKTAAKKKGAAKKKASPQKLAANPSTDSTPKLRRKVPNPHLGEILDELERLYPDADCSLEHKDAFQLLISTILSAQCTDARVNIVTKDLFRDYPTPEAFAEATQEEMEESVRTTGFFRNKAKSIRAASKELVDKYHSEIPNDMTQLNALAGVGRKTANVVLGNAFDNPDGVVVDTHVKRITHKLGLTNNTNPEKIERDLNELLPKDRWVKFSHEVILHGRAVCNARSPKCDECTLYAYCPTRS